jgi:hypothetical protein
MDGDWVYQLGSTAHPDLGWANYTATNGTNRRQWLGVRIRGLQMGGQTSTKTSATPTTKFDWSLVDSFISHDTDLTSGIKPIALGKNHIFAVTQSGVTHTATDATIDFTQPIVLKALNRSTGALAFSKNLSITGAGCSIDKYFGYYGSGSNWRPQISYLDRTSVDGREYVAVMLPEATFGATTPYNTAVAANTRISVVNVANQTELWTYQYPRLGTTPLWHYHNSVNTRMTVAGNALYVAWIKSASNLNNYIDTLNLYDLTLYVDRFDIATGSKTSMTFPLGVKGNTLQLDDMAAVDGQIHILATYREWIKGQTIGGSQLLVTLGDKATSNQVPIISAAAVASPSNFSFSSQQTTNLSIAASDPENQTLKYTWNRFSGPGSVTFSQNGTSSSYASVATFSYPGTYVLECRVSDGVRSSTSQVTVTVTAPAATVAAASGVGATYESNAPIGTTKLTRSGGVISQPLTVNLKIGGTATPGVDYVAIPTTVTFPANVTSITINVTPIADGVTESSETVIVELLAGVNYSLTQWVAPFWVDSGLKRSVTINDGAGP